MIFYNLAFGIPLSYVFYSKLGDFVTLPGWQGIALKIGIDITFFSSLLNILYLFIVAGSKNNSLSDGLRSV